MSEDMSERRPEDMSERILEDLSERMLEDLSERMTEEMPKIMSERMLKDQYPLNYVFFGGAYRQEISFFVTFSEGGVCVQ